MFAVRRLRRLSGASFLCFRSPHASLVRRRPESRGRTWSERTPFLLSFSLLASSSQCSTEEEEENQIKAHFKDLEQIRHLERATLYCKSCDKRKLVEESREGIRYCSCSSSSPNNEEEWVPFLERKDIIVWRKPHPEFNGLYAYKMYGRFHDVTPEEFLAAQMDLSEFRKSWDISTQECRVIHETRDDDEGRVDQYYYWEVIWPKFFVNRDYVCHRRVRTDKASNVVVVYTKAAALPSHPVCADKFRVEDYVSVLTIRPSNGDFNAKGLEFSLTAFENPGLSLPSSITTWVAMRALPEFMTNMRKACLERRKRKKSSGSSPSSSAGFLENPTSHFNESRGGVYA